MFWRRQLARICFIVMIMILLMGSGTTAVQLTSVQVVIDGGLVFFPDQKPLIDVNGRTLVPVRFVVEGLGAAVDWCDDQKQVTIEFGHETIKLIVGSPKVLRLGHSTETVLMDTVPVLRSGRVMVPLRFISETMGYNVKWVGETRTILINSWHTEQDDEVTSVRIDGVAWRDDVVYISQEVSAEVTLSVTGTDSIDVWLDLIYRDPLGQRYNIPGKQVQLTPTPSSHHEITWRIPERVTGGRFYASLSVWTGDPSSGEAELLAQSTDLESVLVYTHIEHFDRIDTAIWRVTNGQLERTTFRRGHVSVREGTLQILLPQNTLEGGEIYTRSKHGYGAYEIRMKVPDAPSSITGFFLYSQPSLYNEIDIEIYNQTDGEFFLTTYSGGQKVNLFEGNLGFDPTADFNNYRIEYYPHKVSFYANDVLLLEWPEGFSRETMHLMLNAWYPYWLPGTPPSHDRSLYVDWIRY